MRALVLWVQLRFWQGVEYLCLRLLGQGHRSAISQIRFEEEEFRRKAYRDHFAGLRRVK